MEIDRAINQCHSYLKTADEIAFFVKECREEQEKPCINGIPATYSQWIRIILTLEYSLTKVKFQTKRVKFEAKIRQI